MTNKTRLMDVDIDRYIVKAYRDLLRRFRSFSSNDVILFCVYFLVIGCSTTQPPAPVVDRARTDFSETAIQPNETNKPVHIVRSGDTLYSISLNHGIDFRELAKWNNIDDPRTLRPGQRLNLYAPDKDSEPALFALTPQPETITMDSSAHSTVELSPEGESKNAGVDTDGRIKNDPKAYKLPYSEQNVARLQSPPTRIVPVGPIASVSSQIEDNTRFEVAPQPDLQLPDRTSHDSDADWIWPTRGMLLSSFSKNSKGVKISGEAGQPILASAAGEVVYSGHGLRGYGNLVIIKHDNIYLSAYAHNSRILVKEGETVAQGQKIAEMGNTDTDTVQLHFEIRKHGKPVDPMVYLPRQS